MKVIRSSNYDDEGPSGDERLVSEGLSETGAEKLATLMNGDMRRDDRDWFRVVPDDHALRVFEP